ncbi:NUDIX domain-containing protein [Candidatus Parcubacteria bacterium]|nr:NUDIX domain-containing protein [Candidatus Parcubacteria bacterium]
MNKSNDKEPKQKKGFKPPRPKIPKLGNTGAIKPIQKFKKFIPRRKPTINEVVREPTSGGMVFRRNQKTNQVEILLIQDAKDRWTIPKGHIEENESAKETAEREIKEETGLKELTVLNWLGKINFRYRRATSLVLMTTDIYLVQAKGDTNDLKPEDWMNGIGWFKANEALDKIEYEDIGKIILLGLKKIRSGGL